MPVTVYLLKHTANEDYGLEPENPNKQLLKEPSVLSKANMINRRFQYV